MTKLPVKPMLWVALFTAITLTFTLVNIHINGLTLLRGFGAVTLSFALCLSLFEAARRAGWLGQ